MLSGLLMMNHGYLVHLINDFIDDLPNLLNTPI